MYKKNRKDIIFFHFPGTGGGQGYKYPKFISDNYETMELADVVGGNRIGTKKSTAPAVHAIDSTKEETEKITKLLNHYSKQAKKFKKEKKSIEKKIEDIDKNLKKPSINDKKKKKLNEQKKNYEKKLEIASSNHIKANDISKKSPTKNKRDLLQLIKKKKKLHRRIPNAIKLILKGFLKQQINTLVEGIAMATPGIVARILGMVFGTGLITNTKRVLKRLEERDKEGDLPKELFLDGHSRGAVNAIMTAREIYIKYDNRIKVHLNLTEPVPGICYQENPNIVAIPPNVDTCTTVYTANDTSGFGSILKPLTELKRMNKKTVFSSYALKNTDHRHLAYEEDFPQLKAMKYEHFAAVIGQKNKTFFSYADLKAVYKKKEMKDLISLYSQRGEINKKLYEKLQEKEQKVKELKKQGKRILTNLQQEKLENLDKEISDLEKKIDTLDDKTIPESTTKLFTALKYKHTERIEKILTRLAQATDYMFDNINEMENPKNRNKARKKLHLYEETNSTDHPLSKKLENLRQCIRLTGKKMQEATKDYSTQQESEEEEIEKQIETSKITYEKEKQKIENKFSNKFTKHLNQIIGQKKPKKKQDERIEKQKTKQFKKLEEKFDKQQAKLNEKLEKIKKKKKLKELAEKKEEFLIKNLKDFRNGKDEDESIKKIKSEIEKKLKEKRKELEIKAQKKAHSQNNIVSKIDTLKKSLHKKAEKKLERKLKKLQAKNRKVRQAEIDAVAFKKLKNTIKYGITSDKIVVSLLSFPTLGFSSSLYQSSQIKNSVWRTLYFTASIATLNKLPKVIGTVTGALNIAIGIGSLIIKPFIGKKKTKELAENIKESANFDKKSYSKTVKTPTFTKGSNLKNQGQHHSARLKKAPPPPRYIK